MVPYNPQSPEALQYAINAYLEQYGGVNVGFGAVISTAIVTTFFPRVGHFITWSYGLLVLTYIAHGIVMQYYDSMNP